MKICIYCLLMELGNEQNNLPNKKLVDLMKYGVKNNDNEGVSNKKDTQINNDNISNQTDQDENTNSNKEKVINNWTLRKQLNIEKLVYKLKYNRAINSFFFFELKRKETYWSWLIIVLSTLCTTLNILDNFKNEPFQYFYTTVKSLLIIFSVLVTLIAAWMKNQQYVERINIIDRYNQKLNRLIEEVEIQLILIAEDREDYNIFRKKYEPLISEYLSTTPAISPSEWKDIVYTITEYYPEVIDQDGTIEEKLWPWYSVEINDNKIIRNETLFAKNIKNTYKKTNNCCDLFNCYHNDIEIEIGNDKELDNNSDKELDNSNKE